MEARNENLAMFIRRHRIEPDTVVMGAQRAALFCSNYAKFRDGRANVIYIDKSALILVNIGGGAWHCEEVWIR